MDEALSRPDRLGERVGPGNWSLPSVSFSVPLGPSVPDCSTCSSIFIRPRLGHGRHGARLLHASQRTRSRPAARGRDSPRRTRRTSLGRDGPTARHGGALRLYATIRRNAYMHKHSKFDKETAERAAWVRGCAQLSRLAYSIFVDTPPVKSAHHITLGNEGSMLKGQWKHAEMGTRFERAARNSVERGSLWGDLSPLCTGSMRGLKRRSSLCWRPQVLPVRPRKRLTLGTLVPTLRAC